MGFIGSFGGGREFGGLVMGYGLWRFDDAFDGVHEEWLRDQVGPGACWYCKGRTLGVGIFRRKVGETASQWVQWRMIGSMMIYVDTWINKELAGRHEMHRRMRRTCS